MPSNWFDTTVEANLKIASEIVYKESFHELFWMKFAKFISRQSAEGRVEVGPLGGMLAEKEIRASVAPITVYEQFNRKEGGLEMFVPTFLRIKGGPTYGDTPSAGKGEAQHYVTHRIRINSVKKMLALKPGEMVEQTIKRYIDTILNGAEDKLTDWNRGYVNASLIRRGFLEGKSHNLTAATSDNGLGLARVVHPNVYVPGYAAPDGSRWVGGLDYSVGLPGSAGYEAELEAAVNTLGAGDEFSCALMDRMAILIRRNKLLAPPIRLSDGSEWFPLIIHPYQYAQLRQDPTWLSLTKDILPREGSPKDNWLLNGSPGAYAGFIIFVDQMAFGCHTNLNKYGWSAVTAGEVRFGPEQSSDWTVWADLDTLDESYLACGLILGQASLSVGIGKKPRFQTIDLDGYGDQSEARISWMPGAERKDLYDMDGQIGTAGNFYKNDSSVMFVTYSPPVV